MYRPTNGVPLYNRTSSDVHQAQKCSKEMTVVDVVGVSNLRKKPPAQSTKPVPLNAVGLTSKSTGSPVLKAPFLHSCSKNSGNSATDAQSHKRERERRKPHRLCCCLPPPPRLMHTSESQAKCFKVKCAILLSLASLA